MDFSDRLNREDYVELGLKLEPGEQIKTNHQNCENGVDHKDRLFIKKTEEKPYVVLAYCHNCGKRGYHRGSGVRSPKKKATIKSTSVHHDLQLPSDFTTDQREWTGPARVWVGGYGITEGEQRRFALGYSPKRNRVILPVWHGPGEGLALYQERSLDPEKDPPKYKTSKKMGASSYAYYHESGRDTAVVVEDILSGIKANRFVDSVVALGNTIGDREVSILCQYRRVFVFMDHDAKDVLKKERQIKDRLSVLVPDVVLVKKSGLSPKDLSDGELWEVFGV